MWIIRLLVLLTVSLPGSVGALGVRNVQEASSTRPAVARAETFTNPIGVNLADPAVLWHDGMYYLYGTSAPDGYRVWSSKNLRDWTEHGHCFQRTQDSWGRRHFWAPEVIAHAGRFYLFYSARGDTGEDDALHLRICLAVADSPLGPFRDVKAPLWDPGFAVIDAFAFIDADGTPYLYFVRDISEHPTSSIYVIRLAPDLLGVAGEPVLCLAPDRPWEGGKWNEGPFVMRHETKGGGAVYVMAYSANGFFDPKYAVGYATAPSPLGPWTKAVENPILAGRDTPAGRVSGPGHGSFIRSPDGSELFYVYHVHQKPEGGAARELAIDRACIEEDEQGNVRLRIDGPTRGTPQALPSGSSGRRQ